MSADIQRARDVLAKWRVGATPGTWEARAESPTMGGAEWTVRTVGIPGIRMGIHEYQHGSTNLALIVGTAGNPDLLDAIDELLRLEARVEKRGGPVFANTKRIAAAIISADERMSA